MSVTGNEDEPPMRAGVSILDVGTGVWLALGILAALLERQRSGNGQRVDASLLQTGIHLMSYHLLYRQFLGENPRRQGSRHTAFAPYGAFPAADGTIMIGISSDKAFARLCQALGKPEWPADPRFATNPERVRHMADLDFLIGDITRQQPVSYWSAALDLHDVANDPIQTVEQVMADRQVTALGYLAEVPLPEEAPALLPRLPVGLSQTPPVIQGPPPEAGGDTRAILCEAGYGDGEIDELLRAGICAEPER